MSPSFSSPGNDDLRATTTLSSLRLIRNLPKPEAGNSSDDSKYGLFLCLTIPTAALALWFFKGGAAAFVSAHPVLAVVAAVGIALCSLGLLVWRLQGEDTSLLKIAGVSKEGLLLGRVGEAIRPNSGGYSLPWGTIVQICSYPEGDYESPFICIETFDRRGYILTAENAFSWIEPLDLLNAARQYAPQVVVSLPRKHTGINDGSPSHTTIWLDYFSRSTVRVRKGQLVSGDKLRQGSIEVLEKLTSGGQGTIYLARVVDSLSEGILLPLEAALTVVLKEFVFSVKEGSDGDREDVNTFNHEASMLSSLAHPGIVRVLDSFIEDRRGYLVLEHVNGHSLRRLVKQNGPASLSSTCRWGVEICEILEYLHGLIPPMVHLDISPDNLILCQDGTIKLIDFTIAQRVDDTKLSVMAGKYAYMPPEQIKGRPSTQSDLYSLGCTLWFLLAGRDPAPLEVSPVDEFAHSPIDAVLAAATAHRLEERFQTAAEMKIALTTLR